jgi:hypothetical protein
MRLFAVLLALVVSPAGATTYDYVGQPFTNFSGPCDASACTRITGSVTFNFDTSNFSGSLSLSAGDTANLSEGVPPNYVPVFLWFNPPTNTYGFTSQRSGNFTLVDGSVTSWTLGGARGACELGRRMSSSHRADA